jgi:hypothetical protein
MAADIPNVNNWALRRAAGKIMCDTSHLPHDLCVCHVDFATSRSTYM